MSNFYFDKDMWGTGIRLLVLVGMSGGVVWACWYLYETIYELLDFQITLYRYIMSAQEHRAHLQIDAKNGIGSLLDLIGGASKQHAELLPQDTFSTEENIAQFTAKIQYISLGISMFIGVVVRKILFDIIFEMKQLLNRIRAFISE